ncbi:GNAT family N-acetyltransferase [Streptomyces anulatus]|uniref:GNAT family N-acetyltransferase n=1 Tax=Streptomyces anulatus TaxID=1892 RepID=UPI00324983CE
MTLFETPRLVLRRWRADDVVPMAAFNSDPKVMRWIGDGSVRDEQQTRREVEATEREWDRQGPWSPIRPEVGRPASRDPSAGEASDRTGGPSDPDPPTLPRGTSSSGRRCRFFESPMGIPCGSTGGRQSNDIEY